MKTTHLGSAFAYGLARLTWSAYRAAARVVALPDAFYDWQQRARTRRQLMTLDDRLLRDMGISRYDALREGRKPFWRN